MKTTRPHMIVLLGAMLALLGLLGTAACGSSTKDPSVASVGGRAIKQSEFEAFLKVKRIPLDDKKARERALTEFLEREALTDAIQKQSAFDKASIAAELREFEKELVINRYFDKLLGDKASEAAVRSYYNTHADQYEEKKVHVAHILFRTRAGMSEQERQARLTAAQEASGKLRKGDEFAVVAQAMSEDKLSSEHGGDLGWLREGSIDPRFSQKVFAMKKDETSEPFETSFGFHIVKIIEPTQVVKKTFEAVQGDIRYELRAQAKKAELERLQAEVKVERKDGPAPAATPAKQPPQATAKRD
jgi:peptidyl-prolyl cis-trans isomerase C